MRYTRVRSHTRAGSRVRAHRRRVPGTAGAGAGVLLVIVVSWAVVAMNGGNDPTNAPSTWRSDGFTYTREQVSDAMPCAAYAYGEVQQHLNKNPCTALRRILLIAVDGHDQRAIVTVSWVTMQDVAQAQQFRELVDAPGTGNFTSLAADHPSYRNVQFTGQHYASASSGSTVVIAEAEPPPGSSPPPWLNKSATVALGHPRP